jgi:hypothetical protein
LEEIAPALQQEFNYSSPMATPKLVCIKLNIGMGAASSNARLMDAAVEELTAIAGQRPVVTKARKSIAQFKLREGMAIGCTVTLRGDRMYEFLDRLISVATEVVRRPRQLYARRARAYDLPGDRLHQDRKCEGHERDDRHDGEEGRRSAEYAHPLWNAVPQVVRERYGHPSQDGARAQEAEVQGSSPESVPAVRAAPRLYPQV